MKFAIVVPTHNLTQTQSFLDAWGMSKVITKSGYPDWLVLQVDSEKQGCAITKNLGIEEALRREAEAVIVLDDDCFPEWDIYKYDKGHPTLEQFAEAHLVALEPQPVELFEAVTDPPSRGTPYLAPNRSILMPVAATMGFWTGVPDYDAQSQLIYGNKPMVIYSQLPSGRKTMYHRFFAFSGMNCAFKAEFWPHFRFDETAERFDDIWMGFRLQAEAYKRKHCINLNGPLVRHSRQSDVWHNLRVEAVNMERNETEWQQYV